MATNNFTNNSEVFKSDIIQKGDVFVGTGSGTYQRLAVGVDGFILETDSSSSTGVKWVYPFVSRAYFYGSSAARYMDRLTSSESCSALSQYLYSQYYLAGASINSSAYFAGGYRDGYGTGNYIDRLTNSETCSALSAHLSDSKHSLSGATINTSAYFAGGIAGTLDTKVWTIDRLTNSDAYSTTCSALSAHLSTSREGLSGATINTSAYFAGGTAGTSVQTIDRLTNSETCSTLSAQLSVSRTNLAGASVNY